MPEKTQTNLLPKAEPDTGTIPDLGLSPGELAELSSLGIDLGELKMPDLGIITSAIGPAYALDDTLDIVGKPPAAA
jgi:hypothetical protein